MDRIKGIHRYTSNKEPLVMHREDVESLPSAKACEFEECGYTMGRAALKVNGGFLEPMHFLKTRGRYVVTGE